MSQAPGAPGGSSDTGNPSGSSNLFEPLSPSIGAYAVKLPAFEGPLDLLLHLIRLNEVDITDIPIAEIGNQYLEYLTLMRELNLEVAGEYLVMAATLAWIKSRMILPPSDDEPDEDGLDPRAELVRRLLEYQRFKEVAEELDGRPRLGRDVFRADLRDPDAPEEEEREVEVQLLDLVEALRRVLAEASVASAIHEVEAEEITVHERMAAVMDTLKGISSQTLEELLLADGPASRALIVATFLALLELTRIGALRIYQGLGADGAPEGPIRVRQGETNTGWEEQVSEFM